jgi:hypothetical protein
MFRFLKFFICEWMHYPSYDEYYKHMKQTHPKLMASIEASDLLKGIKPFKGRFDFAFRNAKLQYKHYKDRKGCEK